jgi:prepilin-type N-terminal cleavage/methylation domain-containing protein
LIVRRRSRGFTLQELMVVVGIMGIVVAVAVGRLGGQGERARDATRFADKISNMLDRARVQAVSTRRWHRVRLLTATQAVLQQDASAANDGSGPWTTLETGNAGRGALVWDVRLAPAAPSAPQSFNFPTVTFRPDFVVATDDGHGATGVSAQLYVAGLVDPTRPGRVFGPQRVTVVGTGSVRLLDRW